HPGPDHTPVRASVSAQVSGIGRAVQAEVSAGLHHPGRSLLRTRPFVLGTTLPAAGSAFWLMPQLTLSSCSAFCAVPYSSCRAVTYARAPRFRAVRGPAAACAR